MTRRRGSGYQSLGGETNYQNPFHNYFCIPLSTDRIAVQLPLASKKLLAMYYYENLPISGIAACFNLPAWRIYEILRQTVGLLGNDLLKVISRKRK
jgi:hypothetical protein